MMDSNQSAANRFFVQQPFAILYHILRVAIAVTFLWSALSKVLSLEQFANTIEAFGLIPPQMSQSAALFLVGAELIAGGGLLFEKRGALTAITVMMLLFIGALFYGIHLGLDIDCGCFGPNDIEAQAFHDLRVALVRDLLIMIVILFLHFWRLTNKLGSRPWLTCRNDRVLNKGGFK